MNLLRKKRKATGIAIIPLIDILAILLIFFVSTTTFRKQRSLLKITPPASESLPAGTTTEETRAVLSLSAEGAVALDQQEVPIEKLADTLREFRASHAERKLELNADGKADLELLVRIWDAMIQAGYKIEDAPARILKGAPAATPAPPVP
jgi:biopolymer transport protein ExbD